MQSHPLIFLVLSKIDQVVQRQIQCILHHETFQRLEAGWRGIVFLLNAATDNQLIKILLLSLTFIELERDLIAAIEYEQSVLFQKLYAEGWGQAGGEPFGLLLIDYYFDTSITVLRNLSDIAASCFVPMITSIRSASFGLESLSEFKPTMTLQSFFQQFAHPFWQSLQLYSNSRFIGVIVPRILMRKPYCQANFQEATDFIQDFLWGNPCFIYGAMAIKNFIAVGWFENMQGFSCDHPFQGAECVYGQRMPLMGDYDKAWYGLAAEVYFTDSSISLLSEMGLMAIKDFSKSQQLVIFRNQSIFHAKHSDKISHCGLHYLLCLCRFAHCLKTILRNNIGKSLTAKQLENHLQQWLFHYTSEKYQVSQNQPLRAAQVKVLEKYGGMTDYFCQINLQLHTPIKWIYAELSLNL